MWEVFMDRCFQFFCILVVSVFAFEIEASAQSVNIPGGKVNFRQDGGFSGSAREVDQDEVTDTNFSGRVDSSGRVSGSFKSTSTFNKCCTPSGEVFRATERDSGSINGTLDRRTGKYSVSWGGREPGSRSGTLNLGGGEVRDRSRENEQRHRDDDSLRMDRDTLIDTLVDLVKARLADLRLTTPLRGGLRSVGTVTTNPVLEFAGPLMDPTHHRDIFNAFEEAFRQGRTGVMGSDNAKQLQNIMREIERNGY